MTPQRARRERLHRLGRQVEGQWVAHSQPAVFACETLASGARCIKAGVPDSDGGIVLALAQCLEEPFFLLYVLHTPRGEAEPGRYQSPGLSFAGIQAFFEEFRPFLSGDGRFDLWLHSPGSQATIVWDRHDMLHAYGPIESYVATLDVEGFIEGELPALGQHVHHYRAELDEYARALLSRYPWRYSPLRAEDEQ